MRAASPPIKIESKRLGDKSQQTKTYAAVPVAQVKTLANMQALPPGFFFKAFRDAQNKLKQKFYALPDYPTAEQPHAVIAAFGWQDGPRQFYAQGIPPEIIAQAAKMGANAVVRKTGNRLVFAVRLSDAQDATLAPKHTDLLAAEIKSHGDFKPKGDTQARDLSKTTFDLPVKRGQCYAVAVALDEGAQWSAEARAFVTGSIESNDPLIVNRSIGIKEAYTTDDGVKLEAPYNGPLVKLRAFTLNAGCPWKDGTLKVSFRGRGKSLNLGTGKWWSQVMQHPITEAALKEKKKKSDAAWAKAKADSERFAREEAARKAKRQAEQQRRDAERAARASRRASNARKAPSGPGNYSLSLKSECPRTLKVFFGDKPKFGSGTTKHISSNSISSHSGFAGKMMWILDSSGNGVSSYMLSAGRHNIKITKSCSGFAPR